MVAVKPRDIRCHGHISGIIDVGFNVGDGVVKQDSSHRSLQSCFALPSSSVLLASLSVPLAVE